MAESAMKASIHAAAAPVGRRSAWRRVGKALTSFLTIVLAVVLLRFAFREVSWVEVLSAWRQIPPQRLLGAAALTVTSYLLLSCFDFSAIRHFNLRLPYRRVLVASFISYTFNFNFGTIVGALALRYRLYGKWGLAPGDVTRVTVYAASASVVGYGVVAGLTLLWTALPVPGKLDLTMDTFRPVGVAVLAASTAYLVLCWRRRRPLSIARWHYGLPSLRGAGLQIALACAQWLLMSVIMFLLLPTTAAVSILTLLAVHLIAAVMGVLTHVPAGLGVLEGTFVLMLGEQVPPPALLATILAYRAVYYLAPLVVAGAALLTLEIRGRLPRREARR